MNKKQVGAWALYDFANSVYPAVMTTAVFPVFFLETVAGTEGGTGEFLYGTAVSISAAIVALSSPLLGAIADRSGARKKFLVFYTILCCVGVSAMTTVGPGIVIPALVFFIIANVGFESAMVFYNAYLPDIAPPEKQGWVSGIGYGVGYAGSAVGLLVSLQFALRGQIQLAWLFVAGFFLILSLPAFMVLPADRKTEHGIVGAAKWGLTSFRAIVAEVWGEKELRKFLIAFFFYIDGVLTIIVMAGIVAKETFGFTDPEVITMFLIVQFSALGGAFILGKPTDKYGPKKVLTGVLIMWVIAGITAFFIENPDLFYGLALIAGLGLGSVQAASRAFMSSLIPEGKEAEMFGFYALCGKTSSTLGPWLFGGAAWLFGGNQRPGFLVLTALFAIGLFLLQGVRDPRAEEAAAA